MFASLKMSHSKKIGNPLVVSAFLHAKIRRTLEELGKKNLSSGIAGVKITATSICILTGNPLINGELRLERERLLDAIKESALTL